MATVFNSGPGANGAFGEVYGRRLTAVPAWPAPAHLVPSRLVNRRTRIIATIGPSSQELAVLRQLVEHGTNIFRLNLAHGDHAAHRLSCERARAVGRELGVPVAILADLAGPKIRTGRFTGGGAVFEQGRSVVVTTRRVVGSASVVPSQYGQLIDDLVPGCRLLLADGAVTLRVDHLGDQHAECTVVHGGVVKDRCGINLPDVAVSAPSLSAKDRDDVRFAVGLGVDLVALSFVRSAADVVELRSLLPLGDGTGIVAKIERPEALDAIDGILDEADGIMVARGDLGVELPAESVPITQRQLMLRARAKAKPVIVATQMLESMTGQANPTRAEVSDVSTAVLTGSDCVMLSAETASGAYPVEAVETMDRIARRAEAHLWEESAFAPGAGVERHAVPGMAFARATAQLSRDLDVAAIVVFSSDPTTAAAMSAARPAAPLLVVSPHRRLNLLWGVVPVDLGGVQPWEQPAAARQLARTMGFAPSGQPVLCVASPGHSGSATSVQLVA